MEPKVIKQQILELCELKKQGKITERGMQQLAALLAKAEKLGLKTKFKHGILFVWEKNK